jgi:hypothetical protein
VAKVLIVSPDTPYNLPWVKTKLLNGKWYAAVSVGLKDRVDIDNRILLAVAFEVDTNGKRLSIWRRCTEVDNG